MSPRRWNSFGFLSPSLVRRYVHKNCGGNQPSCWTVHSNKTTCEEMRAFFTFNVSFGIKSLPETRMYYLKDNFVGVPTVQKLMPRNHFEKIRQYLCLNMLPQDDPAYDKLFKMRPLLDRLASTFCRVSAIKVHFNWWRNGQVQRKTWLPAVSTHEAHEMGH